MAKLEAGKRILLDRLYESVSSPSSFSGVKHLYQAAKLFDKNISIADVKNYLTTKDSYTLHRITRKKFPRRKMIAPKPNTIISCDLADMKSLSKHNKGFRYLLICIDIFSRYLKVSPVKTKNAASIFMAIKKILETDDFNKVSRIHTDQGGEFQNKLLKEYLKLKNIKLYTVSSYEIKAAIAERVIRTLKQKIYKYLTSKNTLRYIDVLQVLVRNYNNSAHRSLGKNKTPHQVHNLRNIREIQKQFHYMYKEAKHTRISDSSTLEVGETVRLADELRNSKFRKGYRIQNTLEIFKIRHIDNTQHPTAYYIEDLSGEDIAGIFYADELIRTRLPDTYPFDIIRKRKVGNKIKYFVSWRGYPEKFNSWISAEDVKRLRK